jgi:hypothetical protein
MIVEQLARMHAKYFNKVRALGADKWISLWDDPKFPLYQIAFAQIKKNAPKCKKACKSVFAIDVDQHNHARLALDNMATYLPQFTNARTPKEKGGEMDTTIMHGDARYQPILLWCCI